MRGHPLPPICHVCPGTATRWRLPGRPPWGVDTNLRELSERVAVGLWKHDGVPDEVYGTCDEHFESVLDDEGNIVLTAAGRHALRLAAKSRPKRTRAEAQREYRGRVRARLLELLGGKCEDCGEQDPLLLRVQWPDASRPEDMSGEGRVEWYRRLTEDERLRRRVTLRCVTHLTFPSSGYRDAVKEAYGGVCVGCGDAGALWVVPQLGTSVPKYPGGRKMGSKDKLRWLVRQGFPSGWELRCAGCAAGRGSSG